MIKQLEAYPFLSEIPDEILSSIDLNVLHLPSSSESELLNALSRELNKNVVIYRKNYASEGVHLCRVLRSASLTSSQLDALNSIEKIFPEGLVLVAYERPLSLVE